MSFPGKNLLKYRPAEQLLVDVEDELSKYTDNGLIDRSSLIKIIKRSNAQLGLKINQEKESVLPVEDYRSELPIDFFKFNYGLLCTGVTYREAVNWPQRQMEEVTTLDPHTRYKVDPCSVTTICCKDYVVTEKQKFKTVTVKSFLPVCLKNTSRELCDDDCPNWSFKASNEISIVGDEIKTNFKSGYVYINYTGLMEDNAGELLVLDHDLINDFYEAALKFKAFDLLEDSGENVTNLRIKWEGRYEKEKIRANGIVNTPEYEELGQIWRRHRIQIYNRFERQILG